MKPKDHVALLSALSTTISGSYTWPILKELFDQYGFEYDNQSTLSKRDLTREVISKLPEDRLFELAREFLVDIPSEPEISNMPTDQLKNFPERKIFISHSSSDKDIVKKIIDIIRAAGVNTNRIFCSSFPGYGVSLGENFLDVLKKELNNDVLVLFVLSEHFYNSPVCLCEMGAAWITTKKHIPILIPPFTYAQIKGVIPLSQGMTLDEKGKLNSLKEEFETFFNLTEKVNHSIWEEDRDSIISSVQVLIDKRNAQ
ncbi:TIR domain-containing protein [Dyadobacter sp. CY343]|uniref:TIR domain-containing protein n=1 Tax=Dyadobacter sp. CY343 TaxID=2907299 RepID=UPI001F40ECB1|nr:TIR domain-containing protein [Dyadobacter sp. CY343]MCE7061944.1 toll/interleukin-1 receptor domain-containing protein [Dyadobacter sp. CY343]